MCEATVLTYNHNGFNDDSELVQYPLPNDDYELIQLLLSTDLIDEQINLAKARQESVTIPINPLLQFEQELEYLLHISSLIKLKYVNYAKLYTYWN
jgi:hypothetical protein